MDLREAAELIAGAAPTPGSSWADLGAGEGVFTHALAERVGPSGVVFAVERDRGALAALRGRVEGAPLHVIPVLADFTADVELPGLAGGKLEGLLFANSLHYVPEAPTVLARWAARLAPRGRVVIVEYDQRHATRWVPFPIPRARLPELASAAGLSLPTITATRPSAYGGSLYVAVSDVAG